MRKYPWVLSFSSGARFWKSFVDLVMKKRPLLGALLCHGEFKLIDGPNEQKVGQLTFAKDSFYERQAAEQKNREEIEGMMKHYFGDHVSLQLNASKEGMLRSIEQSQQAEIKQKKSDAVSHPAVTEMKEVLNADVVGVNVDIFK